MIWESKGGRLDPGRCSVSGHSISSFISCGFAKVTIIYNFAGADVH